MRRFFTKLSFIIFVSVFGVASALLWIEELGPYVASPDVTASSGIFKPISLDNASYFLWDFGVANVNGDQYLDLFTVNHDSEQSLLLGSSGGFSTNQLLALGLTQDPYFDIAPAISSDPKKSVFPGLQLAFSQEPIGFFVSNALAKPVMFSVELVAERAWIHSSDGCAVQLHSEQKGSVFRSYRADIHCNSDGRLLLKNSPGSTPIRVSLPKSIALNDIFVGKLGQNPREHTFELLLRDRHGLAWEDFNRDGRQDVFITRGGLKGKVESFPSPLFDEMFIATDGKYTEVGEQFGLLKLGCPGRKVSAVDLDGNGRLAIFISCDHGKNSILWMGSSVDGNFLSSEYKDVSTERHLAISNIGDYMWVDIDLDRDLDLVYLQDGKLFLAYNSDGNFSSKREICGARGGRKIAISDFDNDGEFEIFVAADFDLFGGLLDGNIIVEHELGNLTCISAAKLGLPTRAYSASWVDYDSDGNMDIWLAPHGLYRNSGSLQFTPIRELGVEEPAKLRLWSAPHSFFDMDNDGDIDFCGGFEKRYPRALSYMLKPKPIRNVPFCCYENLLQDKSYITLDFSSWKGPIYGVQVDITLHGTDSHYRQFVGQSENSQYSQGHYRLYFGLRAAEAVDISVFAMDGSQVHLKDVTPNQIVMVSHH